MSALARKQIIADATLAALARVEEGTLLSYAELTKAMHEHIKRNKLRKGAEELDLMTPKPPVSLIRYCSACGSSIPSSTAYCDRCGEEQLDTPSFPRFTRAH